MERETPGAHPVGNTYLFDGENPAELTRLIDQEHLVSATTGVFPGCIPPEITKTFTQILDVGCGTGGWVLDVAFSLPRCTVVGIDKNITMTDYARARAKTQHLPNAFFEVDDALHSIAYDDKTFDCVHLRFPASWVPKEQWGILLNELFRILCEGGYLIITDTEIPHTNSPAFNELQRLLARALYASGRSFAVDEYSFGLPTILGKMLIDAGFVKVQEEAHILNFSFYEDATNRAVGKNMQLAFGQLAELIQAHTGTSKEQYRRLLATAEAEMWQNSFCGLGVLYTFTAHAYK